MGANRRIVVPWTDLPKDLLDKIAKCLDTEIDVLRFRAVCSSWRSSTTPFKKFSCETVKLPFPFDPLKTFDSDQDGAYFSLVERTVYRVERIALQRQTRRPNFWLVKIERLRDGTLRILNPVVHRPVEILPETRMPKVLNTLDFRVSEVCKAYALTYVNPSKPNKNYGYGYAKKVVLSVGKNDEYVVMAIDKSDTLWYTKSGDEKWTMVCDCNVTFKFHDVVKYKGQFHGIDAMGGTWSWTLDSMFESTRVSYNMYNNAFKRHLVELYNGELFLVEEVDERHPTRYNMIDGRPRVLYRTASDVDIIIYAWDKNEKKWVETKPVNDWIIVAGDDCSFAVSPKEFKGCEGTRVFYSHRCIATNSEAEEHIDSDYFDFLRFHLTSSEFCYTGLGNFIASDKVNLRFRGFHGDNVGVCNYESGKTGSVLMFPEYADIFWPPPYWLNRS